MERPKTLSDSPFHKSLLADPSNPDLVSHYHHSTPKIRRQIQLLFTPHICQKQKDLFTQLLGTETKFVSPLSKSSLPATIQQEMEREEEEEMNGNENENENGDIEQQEMGEEHGRRDHTTEENRKRKRKSNAQLKLLKHEFYRREGGTWSKEKIVEMAAMTGLSESQVYKWCWDQKKKMTHGHGYKETHREEDCSEQELSSVQEEPLARTKQIKKEVATRRKTSRPFQEDQRRVSKKLLFN